MKIKQLIIILAVSLWCIQTKAQGINFQDITFEEALKQSHKDQKLVFIDFYATWCGPCKDMADNVFTLKTAGDYFNPKFVNVKIDIEKEEGPALAQKYGVSALPTFVVLDDQGNTLVKIVGGGEIDGFITRIEAGLEPEMRKARSTWETNYDNGTINTKDLQLYWSAVSKDGSMSRKDMLEMAQKLFSRLSDAEKLKQENGQLLELLSSNLGDEGMKFILEHRESVRKNMGSENVDKLIHKAFFRALETYYVGTISPEMVEKLPVIVSQFEALDFSGKSTLTPVVEIAKVRSKNDIDAFLDFIELHCMDLDDTFKQNIVGGMERTGSTKTKAQYLRMGNIAEKMGKSATTPLSKDFISIFANRFKRRGSEGVYWVDFETIEKTLLLAQLNRKPLFLAYNMDLDNASQKMEKEVLLSTSVGDFINEHFVSCKVTVEKDKDREIAKRFEISSTPSFFIIHPNGTVLHSFVGYHTIDEFNAKIKAFLAK